MTFATLTPVARDFYGLSFMEKNTFLHFLDDAEHRPLSRSRSVPAMAMGSFEPAAIDPALNQKAPLFRTSVDPVVGSVPNAKIVRSPSGGSVGEETIQKVPGSNRKSVLAMASFDSSSISPAPSDPAPSVESKMHAEETTCANPQEGESSSNWDNMEDVYNVMIRGIPTVCSSEEILNVVAELGFLDLFDFFFLPTRIRRHETKNLGYCFIGFRSPQVTKSFADSITGYRFRDSSPKLVTVSPAALQGFNENFDHFRKTHVMKSRNNKPLFVR